MSQPAFGTAWWRSHEVALFLAILVAAIFWLGLFPDGALRKTELAAREYQQLVTQKRAPPAVAAVPAGEKR